MSSLVETIIFEEPSKVRQEFYNRMQVIMEQKLHEHKKMIVAEIFEPIDIEILDEKINKNVQKIGRIKLIKIRVRKGKVQRRKKVSAVKGYTIRRNKLTRMSSAERRHRRIGARKAKLKRRAERSRIIRKRKMSLRKRRSLGL